LFFRGFRLEKWSPNISFTYAKDDMDIARPLFCWNNGAPLNQLLESLTS
jgi:hypothetical protein